MARPILLGLLQSPGGVHSHQDQLLELARILTCSGIAVAVHAFLDGRDTPPSSAREFIASFDAALSKTALCEHSLRLRALLRDGPGRALGSRGKGLRPDRVGKGAPSPNAVTAVEDSYAKDVTDEFVEPAIIGGYTGISDGDGVLMGEFPRDRAREILLALLDPGFEGFERKRVADCAAALGLTEYSKGLHASLSTMFPPESLNNLLGGIVSDAGKRQLRDRRDREIRPCDVFF